MVESANGERGDLKADMFIVSAGAWSRELCKPLGYDLPILPGRGLKIAFDTRGRELTKCPGLLEDYGIAVIQHDKYAISATAFFELKGFQSTYSQSRKTWLTNILSKNARNFADATYMSEGVGYTPCTSDQLPIIGKVPGYDNLIIADSVA